MFIFKFFTSNSSASAGILFMLALLCLSLHFFGVHSIYPQTCAEFAFLGAQTSVEGPAGLCIQPQAVHDPACQPRV